MDTKLRCILLDDEIPGLTYLKMLCEQLPELEVVKAFNDPQKLLEEMPLLDFDLCISDIEMPGTDGLTLAGLLQGKLVIFTTAYKDYAAEAFDIDAVDYITKPVRKERLQKALDKALERFNKPLAVQKFTSLNTDKGKALLYFGKVVSIKTAANDSRDKEVLLENGQVMLLKNISFGMLSAQLPKNDFCRVNKKEIVAIKAVKFFSHHEITLDFTEKNGRPMTVLLNETYRADFLAKAKA